MAKGERRNATIRASEVLLIDQDGQDLGFVPTEQALAMARERGLDLVQLDALSSPPRCQLLDAAAQQVTRARAERIARGAAAPPKEIRLRMGIGDADRAAKQRQAAALLEAGHRVKLRIELEPAARANPAPARALLDELVRSLAGAGQAEGKPQSEKGAVAMVLAPRP